MQTPRNEKDNCHPLRKVLRGCKKRVHETLHQDSLSDKTAKRQELIRRRGGGVTGQLHKR